MPEFILKGGDKPPKEMVDFLAENRDDYLRITLEIESTHERLQRSFHGLLLDWWNSGEWSAGGNDFKTFFRFRNYFKFVGTDLKVVAWLYQGEEYKTKDEMLSKIDVNDFRMKDVTKLPKHWNDMSKKQKSKTLECLISEIKHSMTNNQKVLKRLAEITGDIDMLNDINYYKNKGE